MSEERTTINVLLCRAGKCAEMVEMEDVSIASSQLAMGGYYSIILPKEALEL